AEGMSSAILPAALLLFFRCYYAMRGLGQSHTSKSKEIIIIQWLGRESSPPPTSVNTGALEGYFNYKMQVSSVGACGTGYFEPEVQEAVHFSLAFVLILTHVGTQLMNQPKLKERAPRHCCYLSFQQKLWIEEHSQAADLVLKRECNPIQDKIKVPFPEARATYQQDLHLVWIELQFIGPHPAHYLGQAPVQYTHYLTWIDVKSRQTEVDVTKFTATGRRVIFYGKEISLKFKNSVPLMEAWYKETRQRKIFLADCSTAMKSSSYNDIYETEVTEIGHAVAVELVQAAVASGIMTTSSRTCPIPSVNRHMSHYPTAPYPLLFPPVIGGLSLSSLHGIQGNPPSGFSTLSPARTVLCIDCYTVVCCMVCSLEGNGNGSGFMETVHIVWNAAMGMIVQDYHPSFNGRELNCATASKKTRAAECSCVKDYQNGEQSQNSNVHVNKRMTFLLSKISTRAGLGVGGTALQWFCSYLNGRFQTVVLGDYGSAPWQLCHGVPQGSILSPLLFNIYMKPLGEVIRRCGLRNHQYADDTQLYLSFSTNPGEAVAVLNRCLAEVMGWMRANKLKLSPDKTEVLLVGGSGFGEDGFDLTLNGVALPLRDKVRSLGVLLSPELSLETQVTAVARSAFLQLRLINQLRPYLEYDCLATVTHTLVTSRLDFCNALYVGLPLKTVRILQLVQNRAARLLTGTGRYVHMTPVLRQLHWLPIEVRAQFRDNPGNGAFCIPTLAKTLTYFMSQRKLQYNSVGGKGVYIKRSVRHFTQSLRPPFAVPRVCSSLA
ncbi:Retinoic acid receptor beta, partial [Varanus komodoensis]